MKTLLEAIRPTTFVVSEPLSKLLDAKITIATETFQHTGSFKFRAGYNVALNTPNDTCIASSSGNFGQALARACQLLGKRCIIVMPDNSAQVKVEAVRSYGATADLIDTKQVSRSARVQQLAADYPDAYLASPYDDPLVIEGNSTLGLEIADYKESFDAIVVPIGGGGIISGVIKAFCDKGVETPVYGAEPLLGNDAARSLKAGKIVSNEHEPQTIADGARTVSVGEHNWKIMQNGVADIFEVSEESIKEGVMTLFNYANLKAEPTGALTTGAVLQNGDFFAGKSVCLVVSGGNVDPSVMRQILES